MSSVISYQIFLNGNLYLKEFIYWTFSSWIQVQMSLYLLILLSCFSPKYPDCSKSSAYQKPDLSSLPLLCSIASTCSQIHCCLAVNPVGRNFEAFIDLDPCYKTLEVGIEEYRTKINLMTYSFGRYNVHACNKITNDYILQNHSEFGSGFFGDL